MNSDYTIAVESPLIKVGDALSFFDAPENQSVGP